MAPPESVVLAPSTTDASLHVAAMKHLLAPCEQLDRAAHRGGRARSHGRRLGEARPEGVRASGKLSRDGAPQARSRAAMMRSGCSVPAPCQKVTSSVPGAPRARRPGVARPAADALDKPRAKAQIVAKADDVSADNTTKCMVESQKSGADAEDETTNHVLSSLMDGILKSRIDDHHCEDDLEESSPVEPWEKELRFSLMDGIADVHKLDGHYCEDDLEVSSPSDAWTKELGGILVNGIPDNHLVDEHYCEDDLEVLGSEGLVNELGSLLVDALDGAILGAHRLSVEDNVQVWDEDDLVVDIQTDEQEQDEHVTPDDVDGILVNIFHKAMTSLREELCDEFGMEIGMEVFSDLDADEDEFASGEVFSSASEDALELVEMERAELSVRNGCEKEVGKEAAMLANNALRSALGQLSRAKVLELAEDEIPSEADESECLHHDAEAALEHEMKRHHIRMHEGLEQALHHEAVELANQTMASKAHRFESLDDAVSLASETCMALDFDSEEDLSSIRDTTDEMLCEEAGQLAFEESLEREAEVGFSLGESDVVYEEFDFEEFKQDFEILQSRLEQALSMEEVVLAEEASGVHSSPSTPKMSFLRDMEVLRERAREALLGFESASLAEQALDEAGGWDLGMSKRIPGLADVEEPEGEDSVDFVRETMDAFEADVEEWCASCSSKLEQELSIEAAELAAEEFLEHTACAQRNPCSLEIQQDDIFETSSLASAEVVWDGDSLDDVHAEMALAIEQDIKLQHTKAREYLECSLVMEEPAGEVTQCLLAESCDHELAKADLPVPDHRVVSYLEALPPFQLDSEGQTALLEQVVCIESAALTAAEALERQLYQGVTLDVVELDADVTDVEMPIEERSDLVCVVEAANMHIHSTQELERTLYREASELNDEVAAALTMACLKKPSPRPRTRVSPKAVATSTPCSNSAGTSSASQRKANAAEVPPQVVALQNNVRGRKSSQASLVPEVEEPVTPQGSMVRTPSAAGRLRPKLRESIISFRMDSDDESDQGSQLKREPSITNLYETLGADMHCLGDSRASSRAASPAGIARRQASPARLTRAAPTAMLSAPVASVILSPPTACTRGLSSALGIDQVLKKSAKTRSSSVGALKDLQGQLVSAIKVGKSRKDGLRNTGLRRSPSFAGL